MHMKKRTKKEEPTVYCPNCEEAFYEDELKITQSYNGAEELHCPKCNAFEELVDLITYQL